MSIPGSASPLFFQTAAGDAAGGGPIKSVRFNDDDTAYLSRTPSSAGNRKTWTFSTWCKQATPGNAGIIFNAQNGTTQNFANNFWILFNANKLVIGDGSADFLYSQLLRDPSAWYHIVVACDTTQSSASDRLKIYINGVEANYTGDYRSGISQNSDTAINSTYIHKIGDSGSYHAYLDGYLTDTYFIDGSALGPTSFGAFDDNGVWQAAAYSGSFGTNGFHLFDFANESGIGNDSSGNDNDFSVNNISSTAGAGNDVLFDVPTNGTQSDTGAGGEVSGNYCTWNAINKQSEVTLANGNLDATFTGPNGHGVSGTISISSGKFYWEVKIGANTSLGIHEARYPTRGSRWTGGRPYSWGYAPNGQVVHDSSYSNYGTAHTNGDIVGVAFDADNGKLYFSLNGTWQNSGNPATGTNPAYSSLDTSIAYVPHIGYWTSPGTNVNSLNAGQRAFAYSAPSGFSPLCTTLLPTPTIADGSAYFEPKLFTGTGASNALTMSNSSLSPDWVWIKERSTTGNHELFDVVRGANKVLESDSANAESTVANTLTSFDSNGFTLGTSSLVNDNNVTYAAWCWDAGTSNASNTDGTITSTVRANIAAGFSIVGYTGNGTNGATAGHGLGTTPSLSIIKNRSTGSRDWIFVHPNLTSGKVLFINSTSAELTNAGGYQSHGSSTLTFNSGSSGLLGVNHSGDDYIAYCFAPVAGYSAFGAYTGSSDNEFVHTGFRPALVAARRYDSSGTWVVCDSARDPSNPVVPFLSWNNSGAEVNSADRFDFLSNGFKLRAPSNFNPNESGANYIYVAFAENPFQANGGLAR